MQPYSIYDTVTADACAIATAGVAVSSTTTYYSTPWSAHKAAYFALHLFWTGTPTGTFTLWLSDVPIPDRTTDNDWVQDTTFAPTNPAGAAGKMRDNVGNGTARWARIKYVNASGSGTLKGYATQMRAGGLNG